MTSEVQRLIDRLGDRLRRSVVLNDADVRLVYASQHYGDEDPVRIKAALHRDAGSRPIAHLLRQGVHLGSRPGRIPAAPELGLQARLLVPVRWHGELLGSVVIIDAEETLSDAEIAMVVDFAETTARLIAADRWTADEQDRADEAEVTAWLSADGGRRDDALVRLTERLAVSVTSRCQVLVATADLSPELPAERLDLALRHAFAVARGAVRTTALYAVDAGSGSLALAVGERGPDPQVDLVATTVVEELQAFLGAGHPVSIGVGDPVLLADRAWMSRRQAEIAARAVPVLDRGPVERWASLGTLQLLLRIPAEELDATAVPAPVAALLEADPQGRLVETLEAYLRSGGAGSATAARLHVHRTTLYYRLDQIRTLTGLDIDDGDNRVLLQLGLVTHRLLNRSRPAPA